MNSTYEKENLQKALKQQQSEINDHTIYKALASYQENEKNRGIFEKIAKDEKAHYEYWVRITNRQIEAQKLVVWWYIFLVKIFGTSFAVKSLEKRESAADFIKNFLKSIQNRKKYISKKLNMSLN